MRILFVGAFNLQWSADFPRAWGLKQDGNQVFCFDYRYKIRDETQEHNNINRKPLNIKANLGNTLKSKLRMFYNNKSMSYFEARNFKFYRKWIEVKHYYLKGFWKISKRLLYEVKKNQYDLVFLSKIHFLPYKIIPEINKYAKTWYFIMDPLSTVLKINAHKYAALSTWSSATFSSVNTFFKKNRAHSYHIIEGYDQNVFNSINGSKKTIDVIFAGAKSVKRERFIKLLEENDINVICYGIGWENKSIYIKELTNKYRESKIILNFTRGNIGFSDRVFYAMGSGSFLLSEYCKDLETFFKRKIHLDWFKTENELVSLIKFYLENDVIRKKIADEGNKYVSENFSWEKTMEKILHIVTENNIDGEYK